MRASVDHLRTFNFGQPDQRLEDARHGLWQRWLASFRQARTRGRFGFRSNAMPR